LKLAIDIGGTWLRYEILKRVRGKVPSKSNELISFIESLLKRYPDIKSIAIAFAGQVDNGVILSCPNLSVKELDIANYFKKKYKINLIIENDLNCAVLAEAKYWNSDFLCALYSGTGLGAGVIDSKRLIRGANSLANEIGHIPFKRAPFKCGCGKDNCIELYASGSGLKKWANYLKIKEDTPLELLPKSVRDNYIEALLRASAIMITLYNPNHLILGGGVIEANSSILDTIKSQIGLYAPAFSLKNLEIKMTQTKEAPLEGAKILLANL